MNRHRALLTCACAAFAAIALSSGAARASDRNTLGLIVDDPLPGLPVDSSAGAANGPVDLADIERLTGTTLSNAGFNPAGEQRTWRDGHELAFVVVLRMDNEGDASDAVRGAAEAARAKASRPFASGIDGAEAFLLDQSGQRGAFMTWHQGSYFVLAGLASNGDNMVARARLLATRQAEFLTAQRGVRPTRLAKGKSDGIAYKLGQILGAVLMCAGLVALSRRWWRPKVITPPPPPT